MAVGGADLQVVFLDLPPEVRSARPAIAPPLGERAEVERRLLACFAGLAFEAAGTAVIQRPGYSLELRLENEDPPRAVFVSVRGSAPAAAVALRRLAQQTGWRAFDAVTDAAVDLATGSLPGRVAGRAGGSETEATPWRAALGGLALAAALAFAVSGPPRLTASPATAKSDDVERLVLKDIRDLEEAQLRFVALNSGYVSPDLLASPEHLPAELLAALSSPSLLDARFLVPVRHGYRFEFRGIEPLEENASMPVVKPAYREYAYAAVPEADAGPGRRSFAYYSYRTGVVYVRDDTQLPSLEDTMLRLR